MREEKHAGGLDAKTRRQLHKGLLLRLASNSAVVEPSDVLRPDAKWNQQFITIYFTLVVP